MKPVSTIFLVKDPPLSRLAALVEYLRPISDEFIFVVDDRTQEGVSEVIRSWPGAKVVPFTWVDDFSVARNAALEHVTNPWTLHLDPDELPSVAMMAFIKEVTDEWYPEVPLAFIFKTPNWFGGVRWLDKPSDWHIRLWQSGRGRFYRKVHELVMLDGKPEHETRGGWMAVHAPDDAILIHSKPGNLIDEADALYESLGG